jgi:hypothetical protein
MAHIFTNAAQVHPTETKRTPKRIAAAIIHDALAAITERCLVEEVATVTDENAVEVRQSIHNILNPILKRLSTIEKTEHYCDHLYHADCDNPVHQNEILAELRRRAAVRNA